MFYACRRQTRLHQPSGALRHDDLIMWRDVVAMRVRDECETLGVPRVEPQVLVRQVNAALILNDHGENLGGKQGKRNHGTDASHTTYIDMRRVNRFH